MSPSRIGDCEFSPAARPVTASDLIREGVNRVLDEPPLDRGAWERELAFIDSLIAKGPIKGKRTWKREDLYDR